MVNTADVTQQNTAKSRIGTINIQSIYSLSGCCSAETFQSKSEGGNQIKNEGQKLTKVACYTCPNNFI
jgi:hypothetical protein